MNVSIISGGFLLLVIIMLFPEQLISKPHRVQLREVIDVLAQTKTDLPVVSDDFWYHRYCKPKIFRIQVVLEKYLNISDSLIIKQHLLEAGLDRKFTPQDFRGLKLFCTIVSFSYLILLLITKPCISSIFIGVGVIYLAIKLPDEWIKRRARRRKAAIARELPVVLNTLAIVTEAGLNLIPAIKEVCLRERGVLINELSLTLQEIAMGQAQGVAFMGMAKRCGQPELARFVSIMVQGLEKGSSGVVKILKSQARECWLNRRKQAEELAQKASFKLFLPLLIFFFPAMAMLVLGPAVLIMLQNLTNF